MSLGPVNPTPPTPLNVPINNAQTEKPTGTFQWLTSKVVNGVSYASNKVVNGVSYASNKAIWAMAHPIDAVQSTYAHFSGKKIAPLSNEDTGLNLTATREVAQKELTIQGLPNETPTKSKEETTTLEDIQPSLLQKTKNVAQTLLGLPFQSVSIFGYNVNLLSHGVNAFSRLYPATPPLADEELVKNLQTLKGKIRSIIPEVLLPLTLEAARVEQNKRIQKSTEESEKLVKAKTLFNEQKTLLAENIADFSAISLIESQLIKGNNRADPLSFYLICKSQGNPIKGYLDLLWNESFFSWAVAKISLPFITGFINPILKAGMNTMIDDIQKYFISPQNSRKQMINFFKVASDYFNEYQRINCNFAALKPGDQDYDLPREQYIKKYLKVFNTQLAEDFNAFLSNKFSLAKMDSKAIPWFIPSIFYKKVDAIISVSISELDLMNLMIDKTIGTKAQNTGLTYTIASYLKETLSIAKQSLLNPQDALRSVGDEQLSVLRVVEPKPKDYLDSEEIKTIGGFLNSFLDFLPLEGVTDSTLKEALKSGIMKALQGGFLERRVSSKLKDNILDALLNATGQLFEYLNKDSSGYSIFADQLKNLNAFFLSETLVTPIKNREECQKVIHDAKCLLQEVIDIVVEDTFKVSPLEAASLDVKAQTKTILQNRARTVNNFLILIRIFLGQKRQINNSSDIDSIENKVDQLLINIDSLTSNMLDDLNDALQFSSLNPQLRDDIKRVTTEQITNLSEIVSNLEEIKKKLEFIRKNQSTGLIIDGLIQNVAGIPEKDLEVILNEINSEEINDEGQPIFQAIKDEGQPIFQAIKDEKALLTEINKEIKSRELLGEHLNQITQTFKEIVILNDKIMKRPQETQISIIKNQLIEIEKLSNARAKLESIDDIMINLNQSLALIGMIKESLNAFLTPHTDDEQNEFIAALSQLEEIERSVKIQLENDSSANVALATIKESLQNQTPIDSKALSNAIKNLTTALDKCPEKNKSDQKVIGTKLDSLKKWQIANSQLATYENTADSKDIYVAFEYVRVQLLTLSLHNASLDENTRKTINPDKIFEQIQKSERENTVKSASKIEIKTHQEKKLIENLNRLADLKKGASKHLSQLIEQSFDLIQVFSAKNKDQENTLKLNEGPEFFLGLSDLATKIGKDEVRRLLQPLPSALVDFAVDPFHREQLMIRGPLTQITQIQ